MISLATIRPLLKPMGNALTTAVLTAAIVIGYSVQHDAAINQMVLLELDKHSQAEAVQRLADIEALRQEVVDALLLSSRHYSADIQQLQERMDSLEFTSDRKLGLLKDTLDVSCKR